jgi:hypothetical protein
MTTSSKPHNLIGKDKSEIDSFFLGGRAISTGRVAHLLTSSSFGINAILYATWLGYAMGIWAIIIQGAWCVSFLLFAKFASKIYRSTSLHDFLGSNFGRATQRVASVCSIIGLLYFAGWEIAIAQSGLEALPFTAGLLWPILLAVFIIVAIIYTSVGGQKTNGVVDTWLNIIKYSLLVLVVVATIVSVATSGNFNLELVFPPISTAIVAIGGFGIITNLVFNLSWQFVDNTSWQAVSSNQDQPKKSILLASAGVFVAYLLSTLLGAVLRAAPDLTSDNILGAVTFGLAGGWQIAMIIAVALLILLSMMSLIDGVSLSVSQTLSVDLNLIKRLSKNRKAQMNIARIFTIVAGAVSAWGVNFVVSAIGGGVFDFVYILIVAQLGLIGPVLVGLIAKRPPKLKLMWLPIVIAVLAGFTASVVGTTSENSFLVDGAGTITVIVSITLSIVFLLLQKYQR